MRWTATTVVLIPATFAAVSCKTVDPDGSARTTLRSNAEQTSRTLSNRLGSAEIASARVSNAHEAVSRLRPQFLRHGSTMAGTGGEHPVIYLNGVRQGGADLLRSIPANVVHEIRFLSATAASAEFGRMHPAGVISVRSSP